jgi:hypothetical protein
MAASVFCSAYARTAGFVSGEGAVLEDRIAEQISPCPRHDEARVGKPPGQKVPHDAIPFASGGINRHQIVVVHVFTPYAPILAQHPARSRESDRAPAGRQSERYIGAAVADCPRDRT